MSSLILISLYLRSVSPSGFLKYIIFAFDFSLVRVWYTLVFFLGVFVFSVHWDSWIYSCCLSLILEKSQWLLLTSSVSFCLSFPSVIFIMCVFNLLLEKVMLGFMDSVFCLFLLSLHYTMVKHFFSVQALRTEYLWHISKRLYFLFLSSRDTSLPFEVIGLMALGRLSDVFILF